MSARTRKRCLSGRKREPEATHLGCLKRGDSQYEQGKTADRAVHGRVVSAAGIGER
jgi:hypothetical protein